MLSKKTTDTAQLVFRSVSTFDISLESVCECDFITFYHCVQFECRLRFLRRTQNSMQNVTIVESSETYGKLKSPVQ